MATIEITVLFIYCPAR